MDGVYQPQITPALYKLFGEVLKSYHLPIGIRLSRLSSLLERALKRSSPSAAVLVSNYHPGMAGKNVLEILAEGRLTKISKTTIAREYGYASWEAVRPLTRTPHQEIFEHSVDVLLSGDLMELEKLLSRDPSLAKACSSFGHRATLLHYCGSNGVELYRQVVPYNLPDIIELLLSRGADANAKMSVYGGEYSPMALLQSSAHPRSAGVMKASVKVLNDWIS